MIGRSMDWILAFMGGALLALMIQYNSQMAQSTNPIMASWTAHGLGMVLSFLFVLIQMSMNIEKGINKKNFKLPLWLCLGGIPGACTVILASMIVNSGLNLSVSIALMLVGQVVFGIFSEALGLFGIRKRRIGPADFFVPLCILSGATLIIFGRSET